MKQEDSAKREKKHYDKFKPAKKKVGAPKKWTPEILQTLGEELLVYICTHPKCLCIGEYLITKELHKDLIRDNRVSNPEFDRLCTIADNILEQRMIQLGTFSLENGVNSGFVKFIMQNHYKYSEKSEQKVTHEGPIAINYVVPSGSSEK